MKPRRRFFAGLLLLAGMALLLAALLLQAIVLETWRLTLFLAGAGGLLSVWGGAVLRRDLFALVRRRRGEIALFTLGALGVLLALGYLSARYPLRFDLTAAGRHSLSEQTVTMLQRLEKPVHVTLFHDPLMRGTVELYRLMASQTDKLSLELHDPMLNPAQARLMGVQFAGTAVMQSEDRKIRVHGHRETDIANGILRVTQGAKQAICFTDGHGEADPFSMESHDHIEGQASDGHSHGLGSQYVLHERHGLAKARHSLENLNYKVQKISLTQTTKTLDNCALLVVAGPKTEFLATEVAAVQAYLAKGGNAFFMLEPFIDTGLEPVIREYGIVLDDTMVIDNASHYWADISAPAVTDYNRHQVTRDLALTFYPGVRSLSPTPQRMPGAAVVPLVNSSTNSYGETTPDRAEFDENQDRPGPATLMAISNRRPLESGALTADQLGPQAGGALGSSPSATNHGITARSRIAVAGDADFATNSFFHILGNGNLFLNTVNYLTAQENLIGIEPRTYDLPRLSVTNRQIKATFVLSVLLVPLLLSVIGVAVWWRQR